MNREGRDPNLEGHLSPEDIAVLAEGQGSGHVSHEAIEHLSRCRSCMSAYSDVVRYRAGLLAIPQRFEREPALLLRESHRGHTAGPRRRLIWKAAAGVVVALGLAAAWMLAHREPKRDQGSILALLERASAEGLVIPGGEAGAAPVSSLYRSEAVTDDAGLRALEQLRADYESQPRNVEVWRLAAGLVAAGQLDQAHDYVTEGLSITPADARLLTLAGVLAYRRGDLPHAENFLRAALDTSPGDLTAMIDLGLVVAESRGRDQAAPYLKGVIEKAPHSPMADRARAALAEHGRP